RPAALGQGGQPTARQGHLTRAAAGLLARAVAPISPKLPPSEPRREAELTPMREDWLADCDHVCCQGDGWDPYIPSVTSSDWPGRRWVATSGTMERGRGVRREGTCSRGPEGNRVDA